MTARARRRRRLGMGLLAFGTTGLVLIVAAAAIVLESLAVLDDAASGFDRQRTEVVALLEPAATALDRAATSASNAGASLGATRDAAAQAAQLTSRLADSYDGLAALGSFDLLGTRPFAVLAGQFAAVATEARTVSADLGITAASMSTNITDSAAVAADLHALAARVSELRAGLAPSAGDAPGVSASLGLAAARVVLLGLLVWLAVPALLSLWVGRRLVRRAA